MSFFDNERYNKSMEVSEGYNVSYADVGDINGLPVVCLVGLHGHRHYSYMFEGLAFKYALRLLVVDRPGYGLTTILPESTTPEPIAFAQVIDKLTKQLGIEKFGVMGQSAGAIYALAIAANYSERIASPVVLVSPWVGTDNSNCPLLFRMVSSFPSGVLSLGVNAVSASMEVSMSAIGTSYHLPVFGRSSTREDDGNPSQNTILLADLRTKIASEPNNARGDVLLCLGKDERGFGFDVSEISLPVHVVHGEKDSMVPVAAAMEFVSKLPHGTLHIIPNGTHSMLGEEGLDSAFHSYAIYREG